MSHLALFLTALICFWIGTITFNLVVIHQISSEKVDPKRIVKNSSSESCQAKNIVVFHKTHKCSSTTIQNILLRYAHKNELNVVLPKKLYRLPSDDGFRASSVQDTLWYEAGLRPHIFCLHNRWSYSQVESLMHPQDQEKPVYFSIIRDPVSLFISSWDYYSISKHLNYNGSRLSLEKFAFLEDKPNDIFIAHLSLRDMTLFDFGLNLEDNDDLEKVHNKIQEVEDTFDLIMIVEHFDESIVLLKHLLCWNYEDLTSLKLNVHDMKSKSKVSEAAKAKLRDWLNSDNLFYQHFLGRFRKRLNDFGEENMQRELKKIRALNQKAKEACPLQYVPKGRLPRKERPWGAGVLGYRLKTDDPLCHLMAMQELSFIDLMRNSQKERALTILNGKP